MGGVIHLGSGGNGPTYYFEHYSSAGKRVESFQVLVEGGRDPFFGDMTASGDEIALIYPTLIRAGHLSGGDFRTDREWRVNGGHLVFPIDGNRFAVVNRMSGEFTIIDPRTPDMKRIATPFAAKDRKSRPLVTTSGDRIRYLVPGRDSNTRELVEFATDGSMLSRSILELPRGITPSQIAISGRDVYIAGLPPVVYRYLVP